MPMPAARVSASRKHRAAVEALLSAWCVTPGGEPAETIARAPPRVLIRPIGRDGWSRARLADVVVARATFVHRFAALGAAMHRNVNDRHVAVAARTSFISAYAKLRLRRRRRMMPRARAHSGARTRPEVRQEVERIPAELSTTSACSITRPCAIGARSRCTKRCQWQRV